MSSDKVAAYQKVMDKLFDVKEKLTDGEYKSIVDLMAETRREDQSKKRKFVRIEYVKINARTGCTCDDCDDCYDKTRLSTTKKSKIVCISDSEKIGFRDLQSSRWLEHVEDSVRQGEIFRDSSSRDCVPNDEVWLVKKVTPM